MFECVAVGVKQLVTALYIWLDVTQIFCINVVQLQREQRNQGMHQFNVSVVWGYVGISYHVVKCSV